MMAAIIRSITIDCAKPTVLAEFWSTVLGYTFEGAYEEGAVIVDPKGQQARLLFLTVPEGKVAKNRLHLDLRPSDTMEAEVNRLLNFGASKIRVVTEGNSTWTVMQDPEGNEFCVERGPHD